MSRIEANRNVIEKINNALDNNDYRGVDDFYKATVPSMLIDISRSLAVIADSMKKENNDGE